MNTIHNSSINLQPAGYRLPEQQDFQARTVTHSSNDQSTNTQRQRPITVPTTDQIRDAIELNTQSSPVSFQPVDNLRVAKALERYTQTRNQSTTNPLYSLSPAIDLYA